ncbi:MAG: hypothetical protein ACRDNT_00045 [Streptosporangiaceae bacterium]
MRAFLLLLIATIPVLLTCVALRRVTARSRRYAQAEQRFIQVLQELSDQDVAYRTNLIQAEDQVDRFLVDIYGDVRPLMSAIELLVEIAEARLSVLYSSTIIGILRYGSDRNKANYAKKLLSEVDTTPPKNPRRRHEPSSPSSPGTPQVTPSPNTQGIRSTQS